MRADRKRRRSSVVLRFVAATALGGAMLVVTDPVGLHAAWAGAANPDTMKPSPAPPAESSCQTNSCSTPSEGDEDKNRRPNPELDDLDDFGTFGRGRKPRPNLPAPATGAGTADDEAAANDAVAAAAKARASKPKSNIDMPDAMRAERCANNHARIAEIEAQLAAGAGQPEFWSDAQLAQARADRAAVIAMIERPLSLSGAYEMEKQQLAPIRSRYGTGDPSLGLLLGTLNRLITRANTSSSRVDLHRQLDRHKNNLVALGCE